MVAKERGAKFASLREKAHRVHVRGDSGENSNPAPEVTCESEERGYDASGATCGLAR